VLAAWVHNGDAQALKDAYDSAVGPGDDNPYAVYLAVECTDAPWPRNWNRWRRDNWRLHFPLTVPYLGQRLVQRALRVLARPARQAGQGRRPQGPRDPAARRDPGRSHALLGQPRGEPALSQGQPDRHPRRHHHANSLGGNACVDDQIAAYLADGTLPPRQPGRGPDAICAPLPQPEPEVQAASATAGNAAALRLVPR